MYDGDVTRNCLHDGIGQVKREKIISKVKARARSLDSIGHLGPEAIAAFVDGELSTKATHRARIHISECEFCREEVHRQRGASEWVRVRDADQIHAPVDLLNRLNGIADTPVLPGPDASTPAYKPEQDFLDKLETLYRAFKRGGHGA